MKIINLLFVLLFVLCGILPSTTISNGYDFTSNNITIKNDEKATLEKLYPVLIVKNNTNKDINVTYDFYINENDNTEFNSTILVKANESSVLGLPQLSHLGKIQESRRIWFSWQDEGKLKPSQNQVDTFIFKSPNTPSIGNPSTELGCYVN